MSSSLLLRLFESEHFTLQLALNYLNVYSEQIGVTYYLVNRLEQFPSSEVEFYWPQLCHLLVTSLTESVALENFIIKKCHESTHLAMLTMWYMQASLSDLSSTPNAHSFKTCRTVFNRVQALIFADLSSPNLNNGAQQSSTALKLGIVEKEKVRPHASAAFVGIGLLASSLALPTLSKNLGSVAIAQGRRRRFDEDRARDIISGTEAETRLSTSSDESEAELSQSSVLQQRRVPGPLSSPSSKRGLVPRKNVNPLSRSANGSPIPSSPPVSRSATFTPSQMARGSTSRLPYSNPPPSAGVSPKTNQISHSASSANIAGKHNNGRRVGSIATLPAVVNSAVIGTAKHSASVPSLPLHQSDASSASVSASRSSQGNALDVQKAISTLPQDLLVDMLRSHACRAQLDLLNSLQDISTRLVNVPKMARLSALRAELTVLNHGLPRGCCLGMECKGPVVDSGDSNRQHIQAKSRSCTRHNRIVRISPSETVVLNSADRAPFLMHVEVLEGDLDFDPGRRQNAEDLRAVLIEREEALAKASLRNRPAPTGPKSPSSKKSSKSKSKEKGSSDSNSGKSRGHRAGQESQQIALESIPVATNGTAGPSQSQHVVNGAIAPPSEAPSQSPPKIEDSMQEMDMVEQLYGQLDGGHSPQRPADFSPLIHNRAVDEEAWQRQRRSLSISSVRSSPSISSPTSNLDASDGVKSPKSPNHPKSTSHHAQNTKNKRKPMTIDEYAERMRMAAVMLSQLNANQQTPMNMVQATSGAASGLVGVGMGIGAGIGGAVGFGLGAVRDALPFYGASSNKSGQGSIGVSAKLNTDSAVTGLSEVAGQGLALPNTAGTSSLPRAKVLLPAEASAIRARIMAEMMALEEERMDRMRADSKARASGWTSGAPSSSFGGTATEDSSVILNAVQKEDPSAAMLSESWADKAARIRSTSPYGHLATWNVFSVIIKTGADLRQEQLATQLIREFGRIWKEARCPHWVRYFRILVTSESTGLIETITDTMSIHSIKKNAYARRTSAMTELGAPLSYTLYDHFVEKFGQPDTATFRRAQDCFMKSLASYSVICYLLQIKDRHNGNILIDTEGHIMHIDFGFLLSNSPGQLGFEMAPFKMPQDYIDILGGFTADKYADFRKLLKQAFFEIRKQAERIIMVVDLMQKDSKLPCFSNGQQTSQLLRERFQLGLSQKQCDDFVDRLLDSSALSVYTRLYDTFQSFSQGIL